jgi:polyhydroxyalkanoate synthase
VHNFAAKYLHLCDRMEDDAFLDNFFAMERWANDNIPVAGETFREFVKRLYQRNELVRGQMDLDGQPVRLQDVRCPLLLLTASQDHLVPPASTLALKRHAGTQDVSTLSIDAGHIGLAVSSKAHRQLWPQAVAWFGTHEAR